LALSIHTDDFQALLDSLKAAGYRCVAPVKVGDISKYEPVERAADIFLGEIQTTKSPKEYFLAEHEAILNYKRKSKTAVDVESPSKEKYAVPTLIFGCRPCDAAGPDIIKKVMTWDYDDQFFLDRLEMNVVAAIACVEADEACFCTSVEVAPDGTTGVDILLVPSSDKTGDKQEYSVTAVTEKGKKFIASTKGWRDGNPKRAAAIDRTKDNLKPSFDYARVKKWLDDGFFDGFWDSATLQCIACGTCTFVCPTCHCFDIVDEGDTNEGKRVKNWDSCMMGQFTLHTSGHNPRPIKSNRFRQRIMHKFKYYRDIFGRILCSGCGRCQRHCPTDIALKGLLEQIDKLASEASDHATVGK
jgi:sulfhydrogenase subunit beta (sulfur reductase)